MIQIQGLYWPDTVGMKYEHALLHVRSIEDAIRECQAQKRTRTAVQAGGNVGLWPRRLAEVFSRVITFEPDAISRECLMANVPALVEVRDEAVGDVSCRCGIAHKSLGSHKVIPGDTVRMIRLDELQLTDLDLLQLDVEGYEGPALRGAEQTILRCRPVIQVELRDLNQQDGCRTTDVLTWLCDHGYRQTGAVPGSDFVFEAGPCGN